MVRTALALCAVPALPSALRHHRRLRLSPPPLPHLSPLAEEVIWPDWCGCEGFQGAQSKRKPLQNFVCLCSPPLTFFVLLVRLLLLCLSLMIRLCVSQCWRQYKPLIGLHLGKQGLMPGSPALEAGALPHLCDTLGTDCMYCLGFTLCVVSDYV